MNSMIKFLKLYENLYFEMIYTLYNYTIQRIITPVKSVIICHINIEFNFILFKEFLHTFNYRYVHLCFIKFDSCVENFF